MGKKILCNRWIKRAVLSEYVVIYGLIKCYIVLVLISEQCLFGKTCEQWKFCSNTGSELTDNKNLRLYSGLFCMLQKHQRHNIVTFFAWESKNNLNLQQD